MKKSTSKSIAFISGAALLILSSALAFGAEPSWILMVSLILCMPIFVIALFFTWSAPAKDGDFPFIGY